MTELEYIEATNLAKLRLAIHALTQTIGAGNHQADKDSALAALYRWHDSLERVVKTS